MRLFTRGGCYVTALILAALVLVAVPGCSRAETLPWQKFSEVKVDMTNAGEGACSLGVDATHDGVDYRFLYNPETFRLLVLVFTKEGDVDRVGLGSLDPNDPDKIPSLEWLSLDAVKAKYASPCDYLQPVKS